MAVECNCELTDCEYNVNGQCQAGSIQVVRSDAGALCSTYSATSAQAPEGAGIEGLMGGPGSQMDKALY